MGRGGGAVVAIVTGGNRGLGEYIVRGLKEDGHKIAVIHHGPGVGLDNCLEIPHTDVANAERVKDAIEKIADTFGQIDILVNNAAVYVEGMTERTSVSEWFHCLAVNLTGVFLMTKYTLPYMQARKYGRIVNIGSFGGHTGPAGAVAYNASKAGLFGLTKTVANENARYGITCNQVNPGCVDVGIFSRFPDEVKEKLLRLTPMRRPATPDEVAWPVRWLCSPEASYITGQAWNIDGGIS